jgi:predicted metalloprotease
VPIDFDDNSVDVGGVDDRRGMGPAGGGLAIGGGAGVVGLIIYILLQVLGGGDGSTGVSTLPQGGGQQSGESSEQLKARCNGENALKEYTDCRLIKVYNVADEAWSKEFARRGVEYHRPKLAFFSQSVQTQCGVASSEVGPFYCPGDEEIFLDLEFLDQLQKQFGANGEFAQAYIVAHEYGHHLQTILGTEQKVRAQMQRDEANANQWSVKLELQADCYAGVWSKLADQLEGKGIDLSSENIAEAVNAAQAVGDDRIQQRSQGRVDQESWTHGSSAQRKQWFVTGEQSGDLNSCNTFG